MTKDNLDQKKRTILEIFCHQVSFPQAQMTLFLDFHAVRAQV
jgi:hypothetical protein